MSMNKKILLIVLSAMLTITGIIYFVPRLVIITKTNKLNIAIMEMELDCNYSGESKEFYEKGINISLPINDKESEEFTFEDDDDSPLRIRGNGYFVTIRRKKGEGLYNNVELNDEVKGKFNDATTMNEYIIKNFSHYNQSLDIFSSIKSLMQNYRIGENIDLSFGIYGNTYSVVKKDNYIYVVTLSDRYTKKGDYHSIHICAYNVDKNYEYSADIDITRFPKSKKQNYFSMEEICYIIQSLLIEDY